jgi:hypothetical protein
MRSSLHKAFLTDKQAERDGIWVTHGAIRLRIARHNNPEFVAALQAIRARLGIVTGKSGVSDELAQEAYIEAAGRTLLRDWEGVVDESGEPIPYSAEAAAEFLRELPELLELVANVSQSWERFRVAELERQEKN